MEQSYFYFVYLVYQITLGTEKIFAHWLPVRGVVQEWVNLDPDPAFQNNSGSRTDPAYYTKLKKVI